MRKLWGLLLAFVLIYAGFASFAEGETKEIVTVRMRETVTFGHYAQRDKVDPIEWIVLEERDGKALLLSRYLLDVKVYNRSEPGITWENSDMRRWLNGEFLTAAFSAEEQAAILLTEVDNSEDQDDTGRDSSEGGNNTQDRVFLLNCHEAFDLYFTGDEDRCGEATDYAILRGAYADGETRCGWWWLRTTVYGNSEVAVVNYEGYRSSVEKDQMSGCVRPAVWVNTDAAAFQAEQAADPQAAAPAADIATAADLSGTWYGFLPSKGDGYVECSEFLMLRFDPAGNRMDRVVSGGNYPEYDTGRFRISGDQLIYTKINDEGEYSEEDEIIPFRLMNGRLLCRDWYGWIAFERVEDALYPDDPEASPFVGDNRRYSLSLLEDGSIKYSEELGEGEETLEIPVAMIGRQVTVIGKIDSPGGLKRITVPEGVTEIGYNAFASLNDLERIDLPSTLRTIDNDAFSFCPALKQIVIPEGTESIGECAFSRCEQLQTAMLPESLKEINPYAFDYACLRDTIFLVRQGSIAESWCREQDVEHCRALNAAEWAALQADASAYAARVLTEENLEYYFSGDGGVFSVFSNADYALEHGMDPQMVKDKMWAVAEEAGLIRTCRCIAGNIISVGSDSYQRMLPLAENESRKLSVGGLVDRDGGYYEYWSIHDPLDVSDALKELLAGSVPSEYCFAPFYWSESEIRELCGTDFAFFRPANPVPGMGCVVIRDSARTGVNTRWQDTEGNTVCYLIQDYLYRLDPENLGMMTGNPRMASYFWVFDISWLLHGLYGTDGAVKGYDCKIAVSLVNAADHRTVAEFRYTNQLGDTIYSWEDGISEADLPFPDGLDDEIFQSFRNQFRTYINDQLNQAGIRSVP